MDIFRNFGKFLSEGNSRRRLTVFIGIAILVSIAIRIPFLLYESYDYHIWVSNWYDMMKHSAWKSLRVSDPAVCNYTPFYLYMIWLTTFLPVIKIIAVKIPSLLFEALSAFLVYRLVRHRFPTDRVKACMALAVTILCPTAIMNSVYWCQSDAVYAAGILASLYFLWKGRNTPAFVSFSLAFAFKFQAAFFSPVLLILLLKRKASVFQLLWIPAIYALVGLPALLAGRNAASLCLVYLQQVGYYNDLVMGAANIYQLIPTAFRLGHEKILTAAGVAFSGIAATVSACVAAFRSRELGADFLLRTALFFALILPFFLPKMHERYFYLADMLSIVYGFVIPKRWFIPVGVILVSTLSYVQVTAGPGLAVVVPFFAAIIGVVVRDFFRSPAGENRESAKQD